MSILPLGMGWKEPICEALGRRQWTPLVAYVRRGKGKEESNILQFRPWIIGKMVALAKFRTRDATVSAEGRVTNEIIPMLLNKLEHSPFTAQLY